MDNIDFDWCDIDTDYYLRHNTPDIEPKRLTNGEKMMETFPKAKVYEFDNFVQFWYTDAEDGRYVNFRTSWWNAEY